MKISEAKCPACGYINRAERDIEGQQIRIQCKKCTTSFTLVDHNIEQDATEEHFRLAKDVDESSAVI